MEKTGLFPKVATSVIILKMKIEIKFFYTTEPFSLMSGIGVPSYRSSNQRSVNPKDEPNLPHFGQSRTKSAQSCAVFSHSPAKSPSMVSFKSAWNLLPIRI